MSALSGVLTLTQRNLTLMRRNPSSVLGAIMFPLLFLGLFSILLSQVLKFQGIDFAQFVPPTTIVQAVIFAAMSSTYYLTNDRKTGMYGRWRSLPIGRLTPVAARASADMVRIMTSTVVVVIVAMLIGFRIHSGPLGVVVFFGTVALFGIAIVLMCIVIGLYAENGQSAVAMLDIAYLPLLMFSSAFADPNMFPTWLQPIVKNSPITHVIDSLRALANGDLISRSLVSAVVWCGALTVVFLLLSLRRLRTIT